MKLRVVGPDAAIAQLGPWFDALPHAVRLGEGDLEGIDAVLRIGPRRRAPATMLDGPSLRVDGRTLPVAWLPDDDLGAFARAAAAVHRRAPGPPIVALLAQWSRAYLDLCGRTERLLNEASVPAIRVSSELVLRRDLVEGLAAGPALAVYFGHGRPSGWVGYRGLRARHLGFALGEPLAGLFSLTCRTASRWRVGRSFCEATVLQGSAASALGAVGPTLHTENASWAIGIARALAAGAATVGDLVVAAAPPGRGPTPYRLIGDPTAPLRPAPGALEAIEAVLERAARIAPDAMACA